MPPQPSLGTHTTTMKRKSDAPANGKAKKRAISDDEAHANFRKGLFHADVLENYTSYYATSQPYRFRPAQLASDRC